MENIINLDNGFYLELTSAEKNADKLNITKLSLKNIKKKNCFFFTIDFNEFSYNRYKKILKKLLHLKRLSKFLKIEIGIQEDSKIKIGNLINYDKDNLQHNEFISAINAILYKNRYEMYNYIYDTVCDYLDSFFYGKNLCDFKNNKCGEKRNTTSLTGCCHHFKHKALGPLSKLVLCEYLNNQTHTCDAKCLPCKLFTCDYLESKGIKFKIKDILLLDTFFNPLQKYFIKYMVFTPKDKIIKRLMIT